MNNILYNITSGLNKLSLSFHSARKKIYSIRKNKSYTLWENPFTFRKISTTAALLLIPLFVFVGYHMFVTTSKADTARSYDVVVVGGGTGGVSAAIQAARLGASVAIIEETDWVGGQMTAAGVSMEDEGFDFSKNPAVNYDRDSGLYREFISNITARYGGEQYLHKCYYGNQMICFEPKIGHEVLSSMLQSAGVQVFYRNKVTSALMSGTTLTGVVARNNITNSTDTFNAKVVIDATEYGDVIPLTGAAYRVGKSMSGNVDLNSPIQDITYTAIIKRYDGGIPSYLQMNQEPPNYQAARARFQQYLTPSAPIRYWGNGPDDPYENPRSWPQFIAYRGIGDTTRPSTATAATYQEASTITKTGLNLPNDYATTTRYIEDQSYRTQVNCDAKLRTIQLLYYIQKEMGQNWSVDIDQGYDTAYNQSQNLCSNIPAAFKEIEKRFPLMPYVRESRRIVGISTLMSNIVRAQKNVDRLNTANVNAVDDPTTIALNSYGTDLHCNNNTACQQSDFDGNIDNVADITGHALFQVPMGALIPQAVDGFLAAEKNISQGRIANGGTRLQPSTMMTGQAAGALAAVSAKSGRQPRQVHAIEIQRILVNANNPLTLYKFTDAPQGSAFWQAIHIASLYGVMTGNGGSFNTAEELDRGTSAVILTRLFNIPTNGSVDDAINQLRNRGITTAPTNADFNAGGLVLKGQLALFVARALGQNTTSSADAINYLNGQGISVGCTGGSCEGDRVSRGQMADTISATLTKVKPDATIAQIPPSNPAPSANTDPIGSFDNMTSNGTAQGWVCDSDASNHVTEVHFYADGNGFGTFLGSTAANQNGSDSGVASLCAGTTNHLFTFDLPSSVKDGRSHQIYAYAIGVGGGAPYKLVWNAPKSFQSGGAQPANPSSGNDPRGSFDNLTSAGQATGWACDPDATNHVTEVHFYADGNGFGTFLGIVTANGTRNDQGIASFCAGTTNHAFSFDLPNNIKDGRSHQIYAYAIGVGGGAPYKLVWNAPKSFQSGGASVTSQPTAQVQLTGWQDGVSATGEVSGWACDKTANDTPIRIDFYIDGNGFGQMIGSVQADKIAGDASGISNECGGGSGDRRFTFQLPTEARGNHTLYAYAVAGNDRGYIKLPNSGSAFSF